MRQGIRRVLVPALALAALLAGGLLAELSKGGSSKYRSAPGRPATRVPLRAGAAEQPRPPSPALPLAPAVTADAGNPPQQPLVVADPAAGTGRVEGRVVSTTSGRGVPGAELTFSLQGTAASVRTAADGRYEFSPPAPGTYRLAAAVAPGFLPFAPEWGHSPISVSVVKGQVLRGVTVFLTPAIEYSGQVVDPARRPVRGAEILVLGARMGEQALFPLEERYVADARGEFRFRAPDGAVLEARHPAFAPGRASLNFAAQVSHRLVIRLRERTGTPPAPATLSGRVVDESGAGVPAAVVGAWFVPENRASEEAALHAGAQAITDEDGRFGLEGLDEGVYSLHAAAEGLAPGRVESVASGRQDVTIRLSAGARLRGRVRDVSGQPVMSFAVHVWRRPDALRRDMLAGEAQVDSEGRFDLSGLPATAVRLMVTAPGFADSAETEVTPTLPPAPPAQIELVLTRGARLAGRVVQRKTGNGIDGARVTVEARTEWSAGGSASAERASARTDADGNFVLTGMRPGNEFLMVAAPGHHGRIIRLPPIPPEGDAPPVSLELSQVQEGEQPQVELAGIGVTTAPKGDALEIGTVIAGGGAEAAGLRTGDQILAVEGTTVSQLGFEGSVQAIRGPESTTVRLTVRRSNQPPRVVPVQRKVIRL